MRCYYCLRCTGTGRGIQLEVAIETKRKLIQSGRRHRIISYILSPEGLSPEDLTEKEKVFYAHLKELNAVALGEEYQRPFMLDKKQQMWTGFPLDYVFLVSARSETVSLASLQNSRKESLRIHVHFVHQRLRLMVRFASRFSGLLREPP